MKDHKPNNFKHVCVGVIFVNPNFWDCGSFWCIVQAFMSLCMGKKNEKYFFYFNKCVFLSPTYTQTGLYMQLSEVYSGGNHGPGYATLA